MKKLLLACCIVLGVSAASHAQGRGQQRSPQDQAAALKTSLTLTDDQTTKITAILTTQAKSMDSLRNAGGDMRTAMMPLRQKYTAQIKAVLTPDQAAAYDKQMAAARQGGRGGNGGGQGGGGGTPPPSNR